MKDGEALAYTLWHWPGAAVARQDYEPRLITFHKALAAQPAEGFRRSRSARVSQLPWANGGGDAYQDRYLLDDWATVGRLETHAISDSRQAPHAAIAGSIGGGVAGMYGVRLGSPPTGATHAYWFGRPAGMSYEQLDAALAPLIDGRGALWIRRLVLGPTPEFCLETRIPVELPHAFSVNAAVLTPVWSGGENDE